MPKDPPDLPPDAAGMARPSDALAEAIDEAWTVLSRAHPTWQVDRVAFVESIYARLVATKVAPADQLALLSRLAVDDLYLAFACLGGCRAATNTFFERYDRVITAVCRRNLFGGLPYEDVVQDVRTSLLVVLGEGGGQPDLASYGGRGTLRGWLATVVQRRALDFGRRADARRRNLPPAPAIERDREGHVADRHVAILMVGMLREELEKLPPATRTLLQKRYRDTLNLEDIAVEQGVVISTISRRLETAARTLQSAVFQRARTEHGLTVEDLKSAQDALAGALDLGDLLTGLQWLSHLLFAGRFGVCNA